MSTLDITTFSYVLSVLVGIPVILLILTGAYSLCKLQDVKSNINTEKSNVSERSRHKDPNPRLDRKNPRKGKRQTPNKARASNRRMAR